MEEKLKEEPDMSPTEVQNDVEENDCNNESEKEEIEQRSPRVSICALCCLKCWFFY